MDRVRRLSVEVLEKHRVEFGEDFAENKKALNDLSIIRSKGLKNEIAGYITKMVKNELRETRLREAQEQARADEEARRVAQEEEAAAKRAEQQEEEEDDDAGAAEPSDSAGGDDGSDAAVVVTAADSTGEDRYDAAGDPPGGDTDSQKTTEPSNL